MSTELPEPQAGLTEHLIVGTRALIELDNELLDKTSVLGWREPAFILVEWPMRQDHLAPLTVGKKCRFRFLGPKDACAFETNIIDYRQSGFDSWCWIKWPRRYEIRAFRRHERFHVTIPCTFGDPHGSQGSGEINDISIGGCAAKVGAPFEIGERLMLNFEIDFAKIENLELEVKNCVACPDWSYRIGGEFTVGQDIAVADIAYFLSQQVCRSTFQVSEKPVIAILNGSRESQQDFSTACHDAGCDCLHCKSAFELLSRLKLVEPIAILVLESPDLAVEFLFLLLQQSPGLESLPLYMFDQGKAQPLPETVHRVARIDTQLFQAISASVVQPDPPEASDPST